MYALLFQVSKSGHRDVEGIVLMLGRCLPHIVPNVLLTKREVGFVCFVLSICYNPGDDHGPKLEGGKEMFYLTTHSTHFIYGYMVSDIW